MTPWEQETTFRPVPFDPGRGPEPARKPPKRKHNRDSATQPMSKADMCLLAIAALQAAQRTEAAFKTAIVVEAWRANKAAFGLGGYEEAYPDSNRVIMELVKMKGHGLIRQPGRDRVIGRGFRDKRKTKARG